MRPSMRLRFIISVAAGFLCGDLVAAAQTYSPNDPYWLRPNPTHGGLSTEDYYLPGAQRAPRGTVRKARAHQRLPLAKAISAINRALIAVD